MYDALFHRCTSFNANSNTIYKCAYWWTPVVSFGSRVLSDNWLKSFLMEVPRRTIFKKSYFGVPYNHGLHWIEWSLLLNRQLCEFFTWTAFKPCGLIVKADDHDLFWSTRCTWYFGANCGRVIVVFVANSYQIPWRQKSCHIGTSTWPIHPRGWIGHLTSKNIVELPFSSKANEWLAVRYQMASENSLILNSWLVLRNLLSYASITLFCSVWVCAKHPDT